VLITVGAMVLIGLVFVGGVFTGAVITRDDAGSSGGSGGTAVPPAGGGSTGGGSEGGSGGGSGEASGTLDDCVVGTWEGTEHSEDWTTDQGDAEMSGLLRTMTFTADGTQTIAYDSDEATITAQGTPVPAVFDGEVVYRTSTSGGTMSFRLVSAEGSVTIDPAGTAKVEDLEPGTGDVSYTCDDTTLRQEADGYLSVYRRAG
jgi:hypothetical protein